MRFSYAEAMIDPTWYAPLAQRAEEVGFDSLVVPESVLYPEQSSTSYPYNGSGDRLFLEDKPFIDPFSLIPALGAVTSRLRFVTFVVKLPLRHPVLVAKQASSVAVLTGNRLVLGVGLSPWPEDYEACGQPWQARGPRMDEQLDIIDGLCAGGYFSYAGRFYDLPSMKMSPTPTARVPLLIGGHSDAALERAARWDGWLHAGSDSDKLHGPDGYIARLLDLRHQLDREGEPFEIHVISIDGYSRAGCQRLEAAGVTDVIVGFRDAYSVEPDHESLQDKLDAISRFGDSVIAAVKS
jgi:probable F420-dependent oxidoreductase